MSAKAKRVVCTGVGMVSPIGIGAKKSWLALLESKIGIQPLKVEHLFEGCQSRVAAYVPDDELKAAIDCPEQSYIVKNSRQFSRATTYAMLAAHEALVDSNLLNEEKRIDQKFRERCGVAVGQGMVDFQDIYESAWTVSSKERGGFKKLSPYFMTRALINMSSGNISIRYKMHGPNHCVSTACATGAHAIGDAFGMIKSGRCDIMLCGSTEAPINSLAVAGFERLRALSTKFNDNPQASSRPFDQDRCGFVIGEGSGILILEELEHARSRGIKPEQIYGEILGYGMSSDSHHLTAPLPDGGGAKMAMIGAIKDSNLSISHITHINAHATSTPLGDDIECNAIEDLLCSAVDQSDSNSGARPQDLSVTSCKASIGHLLGGAGSVESIFALLSCRDAIQPHCMNLDRPLETPKNLVKLIRKGPQHWDTKSRVVLKNSFGFGGTNASLVMSNFLD